MERFLKSLLSKSTNYDVTRMWTFRVKRTISRFARGNIAAQNARIQLPEEQAREHARARKISERMLARHK